MSKDVVLVVGLVAYVSLLVFVAFKFPPIANKPPAHFYVWPGSSFGQIL